MDNCPVCDKLLVSDDEFNNGQTLFYCNNVKNTGDTNKLYVVSNSHFRAFYNNGSCILQLIYLSRLLIRNQRNINSCEISDLTSNDFIQIQYIENWGNKLKLSPKDFLEKIAIYRLFK